MAGDHGPMDDPNLKGISRYLNSTTIRGRSNWTVLVFSTLALCGLYIKFKPSKK